MVIDSDPVLGAGLANFPSNRLRLLLRGGLVLVVVWLVVTVVLLPVEPETAMVVTLAIMGLATMMVGWYAAHLWNREVVLYERGFSYREGSFVAYILYDDITSIRQRAERMAYFGGIVHRTVYRTRVATVEDEVILLTAIYRHIDKLGEALEQQAYKSLWAKLERTLAEGGAAAFSDTLTVSENGLHENGRDLSWAGFGGYAVAKGQLNLLAKGDESPWLALPLAEVDNITVLLRFLRQRQGDKTPDSGSAML